MRSEIAAAALVLALCLAAKADAKSVDATCRTINNGAVSRVCRWSVGQGHTVDIYYGEPGKQATAQPPPVKAAAPPPVYPMPMAYEDYGYPYVLFTPGFERGFGGRGGGHDHDRRVGPPGEVRAGRHVRFNGRIRIGSPQGGVIAGPR